MADWEKKKKKQSTTANKHIRGERKKTKTKNKKRAKVYYLLADVDNAITTSTRNLKLWHLNPGYWSILTQNQIILDQ